MTDNIFEQLDFVENPLFESIIEDLLQKQFSIIDGFFTLEEVALLRQSLLAKHEADRFKKAAIGKLNKKEIVQEIRGDFILWIDESQANETEQMFFQKITELVRSEEHTSELQSRPHLVCRLLLEKKKKLAESGKSQ